MPFLRQWGLQDQGLQDHFYLALLIPVLPSKWRSYSNLLNMSLNLVRCIGLGRMTGPSSTHSLPQHNCYPLLPMKLTGNSIFLLQSAQIHILKITMDNMLWFPTGGKVWRPHYKYCHTERETFKANFKISLDWKRNWIRHKYTLLNIIFKPR